MPSANLLGDDDPFGDILEDKKEEVYQEPDDILGMGTGEKKETKESSIDDLSSAFSADSGPTPAAEAEPQKPQLTLKTTADLDPNNFQQKWMTLSAFPLISRRLSLPSAPSIQDL
mmetsp:Transcript_472/g.456  ORF Transcript_472/g.456 Transcript_472/m.456 type:complete len:115 (+) Transcript_472:1599-1943(+)